LRLANSTGIIDSGYRGNIIGAFDNFQNLHVVNQFDRIVQICAPGLIPIFVELVEREEDLGRETARGGGGFGSTGV
jgi:dUTP pyrophosphatase